MLRIILTIILFLVSLAGLFYAGYLIARFLEKFFHINLLL